jgi:hypothetical protein
LNKLVDKIRKFAPDDVQKQARIAVRLVKSIPYELQKVDFFNKMGSGVDISKITNPESCPIEEVGFYNTPYSVVYNGKGICGETAMLLVYLLKKLGFGVAYVNYNDYSGSGHAVVGVSCSDFFEGEPFYFGGYCLIDTTDPAERFFVNSQGPPVVEVVSRGACLSEYPYNKNS